MVQIIPWFRIDLCFLLSHLIFCYVRLIMYPFVEPAYLYITTIYYVISIRTDLKVVPELAMKIKEVPVSPRFTLMLAFEKPLSVVRSALCISCYTAEIFPNFAYPSCLFNLVFFLPSAPSLQPYPLSFGLSLL